ncbi:MAG: hypothetical protein ACYTGN_09200 [Planctomycetota bacterium]|jgi:hypothetical protein
MIDIRCDLLSRMLTDVVAQLRLDVDPERAWAEADAALAAARMEDDVELFVAVEERDAEAVGAIVAGWQAGTRTLVHHDRDVLKRAMKAFRKRLKIVRLDDESSVGGGAFSSAKQSGIVGVRPPEQYPQEVWDALARQKRLVEGNDGTYELPPE